MGVDVSYHSTGLAVLKNGTLLSKVKITSKKGEGIGEFLHRARKAVVQTIEMYSVQHVAMEELNFSSNFKTSIALLRMHGILHELVYDMTGNEVEMYHNATWRSRLGIKAPKYSYKDGEVKNKRTGKIRKEKKRVYEYEIVNGKKVKKDIKYMTVKVVNELYNLNLEYKDNDIADAIGIGRVLWNDVEEILNGKSSSITLSG